MKTTNNLKSSNKFWAILFSGITVICVLIIFLFRILDTGNTAVIYEDGKEIQRIQLNLVSQPYTIPLPGNEILVEHGQISMQSANCPDKLCIHQGTIRSHGRIVCLPNRVMIEIISDRNAPDAKVG